jgi:hypothetical protein
LSVAKSHNSYVTISELYLKLPSRIIGVRHDMRNGVIRDGIEQEAETDSKES